MSSHTSEMTMVERVARAICRANVLSMMKTAGLEYHDLTVDAEIERLYRDDLPGARAAIEAMREPTMVMLRAMDNTLLSDEALHGGPYEQAKAEYTAAIDAALQETKG